MRTPNGGFENRSLLSGADSIADGRGVARLDFDRDGRTDLAVINANAPRLQLFRNSTNSSGSFAAVRLVGGQRNTSAEGSSTPSWSNRDGIGARITLKIPGATLTRHLQAGEGFASQHSATLLIGLGTADQIEALEVHWPSGRQSRFEDLPTGHLLVIDERKGDKGIAVKRY